MNTINKSTNKMQNFYICFNRDSKPESFVDHKGISFDKRREFRNSMNSVELSKNEKKIRKTLKELNKGFII